MSNFCKISSAPSGSFLCLSKIFLVSDLFRYIEGLTTESNNMSNWERQLRASKDTIKCPDEARLPAHWLANNGDHGTSLDALWALRDFVTCDLIGVTKVYQGSL